MRLQGYPARILLHYGCGVGHRVLRPRNKNCHDITLSRISLPYPYPRRPSRCPSDEENSSLIPRPNVRVPCHDDTALLTYYSWPARCSFIRQNVPSRGFRIRGPEQVCSNPYFLLTCRATQLILSVCIRLHTMVSILCSLQTHRLTPKLVKRRRRNAMKFDRNVRDVSKGIWAANTSP